MEIDDLEAHTGSRSFRIIADDSTGDSTSGRLVYSGVPMENDGVYTIAFWAKVDGREEQSRPISISVENIEENFRFYVENVVLDDTDWKEYTLTFAANGRTGDALIIIGSSQTATDFGFFLGGPRKNG